ncbi:uncharacterized protein LOC129568216 isoform X2 [Sitodiplosis mosellana]|nr:uncharacterized protein LOC129568216 isoform X2 [Sitodiplosis mosellana]
MLGISQINLVYAALAMKRSLLMDILRELESVVQKRCSNSIDAQEIYQNVEKKNNKLSKNFITFAIIAICSLFGVPALFPIFYLCLGFPTPAKWPLPFPFKSFFDPKTYSGFYAPLLVQAITGITYMGLICTLTVLQIGLCSYIKAFTLDLQKQFEYSNSCSNAKRNEARTKLILKEAIELHIDMLNIMHRVKNLLSGPLFFQHITFAGFLAFTLLSLDQGIHDLSFDIVLSINCMFTQILFNYVFSSYAHSLSLCSSGVADIAYGSLWYTLPINQRDLILFTIRRSQIPFYLHGYKIFYCSMQTFQELIRKSFSYFLLFRQLRGVN